MVAAVGAGEVHGKASTCQVVALPVAVQAKLAEVDNTAEAPKAIGLGQVNAGPQVMFDCQPAAVVVALEVNTKVNDPSGALEVTGGGIAFPE